MMIFNGTALENQTIEKISYRTLFQSVVTPLDER